MSNSTMTFYSFIKEHEIQIPLIQRDYVQGYALDNKAKEKRDDFMTKLLDALLPSGNPYNIDFIYGARDNYGSDFSKTSEGPFLPLDGQQRLTTLYLLHWSLLQYTKPKKEDIEGVDEFNQRIDTLSRFSYKTRISSMRFCQKLTNTTFKPVSLVNQIKEKYWYDNDMKSDPTIQAMIEMLEQIEMMFGLQKYDGRLKDMTENLFAHKRITFSLLDMEKYNLTDGLYVKMNARGKELTAFENWKAEFLALLDKDSNDKKRFTRGIEHEWIDVFWSIAYKRYCDDIKQNNIENTGYPRADESFMNFFGNICRLFYFIATNNNNPKADDYKKELWSPVKEVFEIQEYRDKVFNMLDTLYNIKTKTGIDVFFNDLFYIEKSCSWQCHTAKVKLFGSSINLFDSTCSSNEFEWSHLMLYAILSYCSKFQLFHVNDSLRNYVRVCRNYLDEHNYFSTSHVAIVPQVRVNDMKKHDTVFNMLQGDQDVFVSLASPTISNEYIDTECSKLCFYKDDETLKLVRKIEDMSYTHGNIKAFNTWLKKCIGNKVLCEQTWNAILAFRNSSALEKVQLFLAFDYKGIYVKDCAHGQAIFIGGEFDGISRWMVHFRQKNIHNFKHALDDWFCNYMSEYLRKDSIKQIIEECTGDSIKTPKTTLDFMLKYPDIIASQVYWRDNVNLAPFYFAMQNAWQDLDIITIHSFSVAPLNRAYQTCPFVNAVARKMKSFKKYTSSNPQRINSVSEGASKAAIILNRNGDNSQYLFKLWIDKQDWITDSDGYKNLSPFLQSKFRQAENRNYYILNATDLVENAVDFMNLLIAEYENSGLL